jgi:CheY-like chemotaxis protein
VHVHERQQNNCQVGVNFRRDSRPPEKRSRILCIDDNDFVRDGICSFLAAKGWACESATGGATALPRLTSNPESIDILITDHQMSGMNGLEFVRKVRATAFTGKILIYSTMLTSEERATYEKLEVNAIVPKTGNPELLLNAIEELQPS